MTTPVRRDVAMPRERRSADGASAVARRCHAALRTVLSRFLAARSARLRLRRSEAVLGALDDRMLKDLGLHRSEIGSVLTHPEDRADR